MDTDEVNEKLQDVEIAIKTLCSLYPRVGGYNEPKTAGVVLRRFQLRRQDLIDFLSCETK